jgi:hypothetical protein
VKPFVRSFFVLAVAWAASTAQAEAVSSASVTLSNLRYELISLDAGSGVTPALVAQNAAWVGSTQVDNTYYDSFTALGTPQSSGWLFGAPSESTATSADGFKSVSYGGTTLSASLNLPASNVTLAAKPYGASGDSTTTLYFAWSQSGVTLCPGNASVSDCQGQAGVFTLSPHTAVEISGVARMSFSADRSGVIDHFHSFTDHVDNITVSGGNGVLGAQAFITMGDAMSEPSAWQAIYDPNTLMAKAIVYSNLAFAGADASFTDTSLTADQTWQQNLSYRFENNSDQVQSIGIFVGALAYYGESVMVTTGGTTIPEPTTGIVPEPASAMLMALGLGGLLAVCRRHKA